MQKKKNKSLKDVGNEWDLISKERQNAIEQGLDISLLSVTAPWILKHIDKEQPKTVLDVGCGTGYLTSLISQKTNICYGIDISKRSIDIAKSKYGNKNTHFFLSSIKDFHSDLLFDCCVSNMVFMSDPEIEQSLKNIYANLKNDGLLYIMITHPFFWPTRPRQRHPEGARRRPRRHHDHRHRLHRIHAHLRPAGRAGARDLPRRFCKG